MHPANHPHQLQHERQYPPYGPSPIPHVDHVSKGPIWACLLLLMLAVSALWKMSEARSERWLSQPPQPLSPSESAVAHLEPGESGSFRPAPVGPARIATAAEQALDARLAELESQMARTERKAVKVGQQEAFSTFEARHHSLRRAVAERGTPWTERDCLRLDREAQVLIKDVAKFSNELEEVAAVQL